MNTTTLIILLPIWIILCLFFHELGHYLQAKKYNLNPKLGFDKKGFYISHKPCSKEKEINITKAGVIMGYLPLIVTLAIDLFYGWCIIAAWTIGNIREIKKIIKS